MQGNLEQIAPDQTVTILIQGVKAKTMNVELVDNFVHIGGKRRPVRYLETESTIFIDEQDSSGKTKVLFKNGKFCYVPQDNMTLHEFFINSISYSRKSLFSYLDLDAKKEEAFNTVNANDEALELYYTQVKTDPEGKLKELCLYLDIKTEDYKERIIRISNFVKGRPAEFIEAFNNPYLKYVALVKKCLQTNILVYNSVSRAFLFTEKSSILGAGEFVKVEQGRKHDEWLAEYLSRSENSTTYEELLKLGFPPAQKPTTKRK